MLQILSNSIILIALYLLVTGNSWARSATTMNPSVPTTTTTTAMFPDSSLEDPSNSAATTSELSDESSSASEDICLRCFDKVKVAQELIDIQASLVTKQRKLIQRKNKVAAAEAAAALDGTSDTIMTTTVKPARNQRKTNSTVRNRTLQQNNNNPTEQIVVSRLRVARSTEQQQQQNQFNKSNGGNKFSLNKKDPDLKRLKQEQQQQLNATCKSLLIVQECLSELSRECIGNLHFHSLEIYSNQWHSKLNCPYRNNPGLKVFRNLVRNAVEVEPEKVPIPRPISSDEEVRKRLDRMFPNGVMRPPLGVMLNPSLTSSGTQKFNSMGQQQEQTQQQQQPQQPYQQYFQQQAPGRHLVALRRDFSGHQYVRQVDDGSFSDQILPNMGKVLLVPCCLAILVAFITLTSLYLRRPPLVKSP